MPKNIKQPALKKNKDRNERRNRRIGLAKEYIRQIKRTARCDVCGTTEPLTFYGRHRDLSFAKVMTGAKSMRAVRRRLKKNAILCLNHAALRRESNEDRSTYHTRTRDTRVRD